jgi:serine/threonine-protein kinase
MSGPPSPVSTASGSARLRRTFPPRIVGTWKIDALLDEGTFARTYRARPADCPPHRPADYALKVLRKELEDNEQIVEMVQREAYVGRRLSHPHLVPILDANVKQSPFFVVMPCLPGATLRQAILNGQLVPLPHALWIARQVAEGLSALHDTGWLHGDVKPSNVLVSADGHVTLVDLGMARRIDRPGSIVDRPFTGTLNYMSPELVVSAVRADQRSDIYSLGVTLYRSLTGQLPFTAETAGALVRAHRELSVPDPRRLRPQLPRNVCSYVLRMMAKQPIRRPQTAQEVADQLMRFEIETFEERFAA